jgi:hypothetical protein
LTILTSMKQKSFRIIRPIEVSQPVVRGTINVSERNRERASGHCLATALSINLVS